MAPVVHLGWVLAAEAAAYAIPLVMCKFAFLVAQAVETGLLRKHIPFLATAHNSDFVATFVA